MLKTKIILYFIVAATLSLSCSKPAAEKSFDLGAIRINGKDIVLIDSSGTATPSSKLYTQTIDVDTITDGVYHITIGLSANETHRVRDLKIMLRFLADSLDHKNVKNSFH